jgi:Ankyrin repeats (3 copies)
MTDFMNSHANPSPPLPPLHHTLSVNTLLIHKADKEAGGYVWDSSPLMEAAGNGHHEVVRLLLSSGADIHHKDKYGRTTLHWAAWNGHLEMVKELMKNGARVEADNDGETPIAYATLWGHSEVANFIKTHMK